jgi:hypothetical protein
LITAARCGRLDDAVFDDGGTRTAGVPEQVVEVRDVDKGHAVTVGHRMAAVDHVLPRSVVLHVDHGDVPPEPPPEPRLGQLPLVRTLQDHHIDVH